MARLDRLVTAKGIAQLAAVIGRQFAYALLQAVSQLDEVTLQRELGRLVEAELLYQRGLPPQSTYMFKHALIQDAAYQSLLKSTRQQYHQRIAHVLEAQFPETAEAQPELVAHHYTEAGLNEQAIPYWHRAGQRAIQHSAHLEAMGHLSKGLELLKTLPETPECTQQELDLQITLGPVLMTTKGWSASEVGSTYTRARELCGQVGDTARLFPVLRGLCEFYQARGQLQQAYELAVQLLTLTQRVHTPDLLVVAHNILGDILFWRGELGAAREHFERGLACYNRQQHRALAFSYGGYDPGVACFALAACTLWLLGYPDLALRRSQEARTLARDLSHPHSRAFALHWTAVLHHLRREVPLTQEVAEAGMGLCTEQGFPFYLAVGTILRGWALAAQGQPEEGLGQMQKGLAAYQATGAALEQPFSLILLADAYGRGNRAKEGLQILCEAGATVSHMGEQFYEAELYRLKGELLLALPTDNQAEAPACFHHALDIARHQQAKSLELRAAMSLARLWQRQGKLAEAHALLAPIYGWFTEGFDTADLQDAKVLLEELAG